jgi:hypothetical protein
MSEISHSLIPPLIMLLPRIEFLRWLLAAVLENMRFDFLKLVLLGLLIVFLLIFSLVLRLSTLKGVSRYSCIK